MVKIDLGAHIDGHIVLAAHTVIVGADLSSPESAQAIATGRRAAVINATYTAAEVAAKMIKNGTCCSLVLRRLAPVPRRCCDVYATLKWAFIRSSTSWKLWM
jgi:methionine aminopeptidase